jgi:fatty acid desaturase
MRKNIRAKNLNFALKFATIVLAQLVSVQAMLSQNDLKIIGGIALMGFINAHAIQVIHQCIHYMGFRNKILNDLAGNFLSFPVMIDFYSYRKEHFRHHQNLGTAKNTEFFGFNEIREGISLSKLSLYIFGIAKYSSLVMGCLSKDSAKRNSSLRVLLFWAMLAALLIVTAPSNVIFYFLISLVCVTEPLHFFIEMPEHYGCKNISLEKYENTRTLKNASLPMRWFTNWNNFHVEHHLYQWVLPEELHLHHDSEKSQRFNPAFNSYIEFYSYFIKVNFKQGVSQ